AEAFADLSALQHPAPRRALVIGGGLEGVPAALVPHGLSSIDNLEIDERAFDLGRRYSERLRVPRGTGAVPRLIIGEPRRFFEDAGLYDLILVAMPEPTSGETSRFYTQEFFARCAQHLAPGGVLGIRLPAAENFWPPPLVRLVATIVDALRLEFHHTSVVPGATLYVFASPQPLPSDADVLVGRLAARRVHATLVTPPYLHYLYGNDRRGEVQRVLSGLPVSRPNRDAAPVCYQYAAMLWLAKFYPAVARAEARAGASAVWLACGLGLAVLGLGVAWMRRTAARRAVAFVALVGGAAMGLETVLILRYQMANGVVFVNVGWLLTCFMAGLTAGAWLACPSISRGRPRRSGVALGGTMCLLSGVVAAMTRVEWAADLAGVSVLLLAIGSSAGAAFGYAAGQWEGRGDRAASALYAADVAGGAIAAWGTTLVLVPLAGLGGTALAMAALGAAMLFVIPRSGCGR
ncbi:MAG: hypothetical protein NTY02_10310, partial [Acidobacteria bacterium]|nr:hypothetical protein [Acidobacteriota bacterium]